MLKRGADQDEGPEAKKAPVGKGGASGMRADEVTNPIPRLFKQNSITIHITQRTFEEIGPGSLKWIPTCQYWAAMFDKFHWNQFDTYFKRCSTFQITDPKVRISNILMLQDEQTTQAGTPRDMSVFTQACYLMHYQPRGIKNWFRLGTTSNCMQTQEYLKYQPMKTTDCELISQLVEVGPGTYKDFERLIINPSKADAYAGWNSYETMATKQDTTTISPAQLTEETNIEEETLDVGEDYNISEVYISPRSRYLGEFSCSVKGLDYHVGVGKHTTYARNLDKINLHKYGDSFGFHINTNMEGLRLLRHDANHPFGKKYTKYTKGDKTPKTDVYSVFCYPSENRPFYGRFDNLDMTGPIASNKGFQPLTHHFLTMPPIKKNDGTLIKQRCSFIMEQTVSVTFHFPETVAEEEAEHLLDQRNAAILRPAIVKVNRTQASQSPTGGVGDYIRDKLREFIQDNTKVDFPLTPDDWDMAEKIFGERVPLRHHDDRRWSLPGHLALLCSSVGFSVVCSYMGDMIKSVAKGRPDQIDWRHLPEGAPPLANTPEPRPPDVTEWEEIAGKIVPKLDYKYKIFNTTPITAREWEKMVLIDLNARSQHLFGFLFYDFLRYMKENGAFDIPWDRVDSELPDNCYNTTNPLTQTICLGEWLRPLTQMGLRSLYNNQCPEIICRIYPQQIKNFSVFDRYANPQEWDKWVKVSFESLVEAEGAPIDFNIYEWLIYLHRMNVNILPTFLETRSLLDHYNECVKRATDDVYPRIRLTKEQIDKLEENNLLEGTRPMEQRLEPIPPLDNFMNYETSMFFV